MSKSQSVAARAAMAVGLMFGFYVLAISLIALLVFIPILGTASRRSRRR